MDIRTVRPCAVGVVTDRYRNLSPYVELYLSRVYQRKYVLKDQKIFTFAINMNQCVCVCVTIVTKCVLL